MSGPVCVDASLFLSIVFEDPHQATASRLWEEWLSAGTQLVAPPLFYAEITSVIRLSNHRGDLSPSAAHEALAAGLSSPVEIWQDSRALRPRLWAKPGPRFPSARSFRAVVDPTWPVPF